MIIAVDFDGTIVEHRYPEIGPEKPFAVQTLRMLMAEHHQLVLWTVREGRLLDDAVNWCRERGIEFYAVNREYPEETTTTNDHFSRKIKADVFIDDSNLGGLPDWGTIYRIIHEGTQWRHLISESDTGYKVYGRHKRRHWWKRLPNLKNKRTNMKKHFLFSFLLLLTVAVLMLSCASTKHVAYIQNSGRFDSARSSVLYDARIMPKDVLTITVNTVNPEASAPFNLIVAKTLSSSSDGQTISSSRALLSYLVSNEGTIDFPVLGTLKVGGLTKTECEKLIYDKVLPYLNVKENPVVTVNMSNYKISVLGEVANPGMFSVSNEKINIFEALAKAGDLTIYGVRDRVKLIREDAKGKKEVYTLNLNDVNIINSPYYYLQQNDIVYVEPNRVKSRNASVGQTTSLWLTSTSILISLASLLYTILK